MRTTKQMISSVSPMALNPCCGSFPGPISQLHICSVRTQLVVTKCGLNEPESKSGPDKLPRLEIGSPIIMTEAPKLLKTAASVPCLRANAGLVKQGDVGR